jgi:hypothetical protein
VTFFPTPLSSNHHEQVFVPCLTEENLGTNPKEKPALIPLDAEKQPAALKYYLLDAEQQDCSMNIT